MVTITLHCPHCQSEALVHHGHAPNGKQLYRCRACGRQSRKNPTPHVYPQTRREEILHAYARTQHSPGPHSYLWRLAYDRLKLDQKKVAQLPPLCTTLLAPPPEDPTSTILELDERMARLSSKKLTTPGFGWRCAERADKWSPIRLGIGANRHVSGCGRPFQRGIAKGTASRTSGQHTRQ